MKVLKRKRISRFKNHKSAFKFYKHIKENPVDFIRYWLKYEYCWSKQREIAQSVRDNRYTIVSSTTGTGKTQAGAMTMVWSQNAFAPNRGTVVAPNLRIVNDQLFEEMRRIYKKPDVRCQLAGKVYDGKPRLYIAPGHFCTGFSASDTKESGILDKMTGKHAKNTYTIFDQACGLSVPYYKGLEGLMDSDHARALIMSNPFKSDSEFARIWRGESKFGFKWNRIKITAFDNPNVKYRKTIIPGMSTYTKFQESIAKWAESDPLYQIYILANFVEDYNKILIPPTLMKNIIRGEMQPDFEDVVIGLDVADDGPDLTFWTVRAGGRVIYMQEYRGMDLMKIADMTAELIDRLCRIFPKIDPENVKIMVDAIGIGAGVYYRLRQLGYTAYKIKVGKSCHTDELKEDFRNCRAYFANHIKDCCYKYSIDVMPIYKDNFRTEWIENLIQDGQIRYFHTSTGQIQLEEKTEFKKRNNRSTDILDSLYLCFLPYVGGVLTVFEDKKRYEDLTAQEIIDKEFPGLINDIDDD